MVARPRGGAGRVRGTAAAALGLVATVVLAGCGTDEAAGTDAGPAGVTTVRIVAASSLVDVFTDLAEAYEAENPGVDVQLEFGPSTRLAEGLAERTDVQLYAAADDEAMGVAVGSGAAEDPVHFARNHVVVAVPSGRPTEITGLADLAREDLTVGICDPEAPCGRASAALLAAAGVVPSVDRDAVDSRALLGTLTSAEVDVGIVYLTDIAASRGWVSRVELDGPETTLTEQAGALEYSLARVTTGTGGPEVERAAAGFRDFLHAEDGREILADAGFQPLDA